MIRQAGHELQAQWAALTLILFCFMFAGLSGCAQLRGPGEATSEPSPSESSVPSAEEKSVPAQAEPTTDAQPPAPKSEVVSKQDPEPSFPGRVSVPIGVVERLQTSMIEVIKESPALSYEERFKAIEKIAQFSFDIPGMARASYGPGYGSLTAEQKRTWLATYEKFHISSLAYSMQKYRGQTYRTLGYLEPGHDLVIVESKLDFPGRIADVLINYRVFRTHEGWRIVDVYSPPTVSEIAVRRAEYQTVLDRRGFDGLIAEMQARVAKRGGS